MAKAIDPAKKAEILNNWAAYKANGGSLAKFRSEGATSDSDFPSYATLVAWTKGSEPTEKKSVSAASSGGLYDEFTATLLPEDLDKKYIKFLEGKVTELQERIRELENQG
jgi:hypothetical protein